MSFLVLEPWKACHANRSPMPMQLLLPSSNAPTWHDQSDSFFSTPLQGKILATASHPVAAQSQGKESSGRPRILMILDLVAPLLA